MDSIMECGCSANATTVYKGESMPVCIIHDCFTIKESQPDFTGRKARCTYYGTTPSGRNHEGMRHLGCERGKPCMCEVDSSPALPFFKGKMPGMMDDKCKQCIYYKNVHIDGKINLHQSNKTKVKPHEFDPKLEGEVYDEFYCGCWSWD